MRHITLSFEALEPGSKAHPSALLMLRQIPYAKSRQEAARLKGRFQPWSRKNGSNRSAAAVSPRLRHQCGMTSANFSSSYLPRRRQTVTVLGSGLLIGLRTSTPQTQDWLQSVSGVKIPS